MILELVALRLLCAVAEPHTYSETAVTVECAVGVYHQGQNGEAPGLAGSTLPTRWAENAEPDRNRGQGPPPDGGRLTESPRVDAALPALALRRANQPAQTLHRRYAASAMKTAGSEKCRTMPSAKGLGDPGHPRRYHRKSWCPPAFGAKKE